MADTNTTKLNADNHLLLDQPLLRLPLELQRRNFKACQVKIDHEQKKTTELLRAAAKSSSTASADESIKVIDTMLARMESMKAELERLHEEEQSLHEQSAKRIEHLEELYQIPSLTDVKYENWSRTRLDRLVVDYLLRAGYSETAASLASAKSIEDLIDLDTFVQCQQIADSIQEESTTEALRWLTRNKDSLKKHLEKSATEHAAKSQTSPNPATIPKITPLEFELRFQEYIILLSRHPADPLARYEAILHAQKYLSPHMSSFPDQNRIIAGLLAVDPLDMTETTNPYVEYFSPTRWTYLSNLFIDTHHALLQLPSRPLLHVALSAGLSALKTPACHSALNPASADNESTHAKFTLTPAAASSLSTSGSHGIGSSLCPICSTELNALARNVPYAHHTKSSVENDPLMLPNGRVYGRERLEEAERKRGRIYVDPTTSKDYSDEEVGESGDDDDDGEGEEVEGDAEERRRRRGTRTIIDPVTGQRFWRAELKKVYIT